jgi:hypothetical protein
MSARKVVAYNVRAMMGVRPGLDDPKKLAKATIYPFGKKAGKNPSVRSIQYLISDSAGAPAAGLDLIAGVAKAFGREPWELLLDDAGRRAVVSRILSATAAPDERIPPQFSAKHRSPKATKK